MSNEEINEDDEEWEAAERLIELVERKISKKNMSSEDMKMGEKIIRSLQVLGNISLLSDEENAWILKNL